MSFLKRYGIPLLVGLAICLVALYFLFGAIFPGWLSQQLTRLMNVPVKIESFFVAPTNIRIGDLSIRNPPHFALPYALRTKTIDMEAPIHRYLQDSVVIDTIYVRGTELSLVFNSASDRNGNWTAIMKDVEKNRSSDQKHQKTQVLIKRLIVEDIDVDLVFLTNPHSVQRLPHIDRMEFTHITSQGGFPMSQVMDSVLGQMLQSVFIRENLKNMLQDLIQSPDSVRSLVNPLIKSVF